MGETDTTKLTNRRRLGRVSFHGKTRSLALPAAMACMAFLVTGCQTLKQPPRPAYPLAATPEDVLAADQALASAKSRFVVFNTTEGQALKTFTPDNGGVVVELDQQRAYVYQEGRLAAVSRIASGRRNFRTETGFYTIGQKSKNHRSNVYGDYVDAATGRVVVGDVDTRIDSAPAGAVYRGASMANFCRLHFNGKSTPIGFHRGYVPNYPASHGCIRLPGNASEFFFQQLPIGFPVIVRGEKYGVPYGTKQRGAGKRAPKTVKAASTIGTETGESVTTTSATSAPGAMATAEAASAATDESTPSEISGTSAPTGAPAGP